MLYVTLYVLVFAWNKFSEFWNWFHEKKDTVDKVKHKYITGLTEKGFYKKLASQNIPLIYKSILQNFDSVNIKDFKVCAV